MGSGNKNPVRCEITVRLKREDCKRTKHDSLFSPWKLLIGPFDWKDHSIGKEGAERYRVHNLPNGTSCPGIYELGISVPKSHSGRESGKLDPNNIVPVYIGQADNVRTRLQQYGREGAHLENGKFASEVDDSVQGPKLFSDIFSRGYSVLYRWSPMKNKKDAEKAEARLLDTFDYAWNKDSNGVRRPNDVYKKLDIFTIQNSQFPSIAKKFRFFPPKKVGIKIKPCNSNSNLEKNNIFSRIFKIGRCRPINVSSKSNLDESHTSICGVSLGRGSVCQKPPIEGRKRCNEHKGMKINGLTSKLFREDDFENNVFFPACGVILENGMICDEKPVQGRKRCVEHKGMRIRGLSKLVVNVDRDESYKMDKPETLMSTERADVNKIEISCGVNLSDGTFCNKTPVRGRKRCQEHKGMRINGL